MPLGVGCALEQEGPPAQADSAALRESPTRAAVLANAEVFVSQTGRDLVTMLKARGALPASTRLFVQGDPRPADGVGARIAYQGGARTHVVYVSDPTFEALRREHLSQVGLALMLCHEIGHHFANGEEKTEAGGSWSEGEADYFAAASCIVPAIEARIVRPDAPSPADKAQIDEGLRLRRLSPLSASGRSALLGARSLLAAVDAPMSFVQPDMSEAINALPPGSYPSPSCRMETYVAGVAGATRPTCWAPRGEGSQKCASAPDHGHGPYAYTLTEDDHILVRGDRGRTVADLQARPRHGVTMRLGGRDIQVYFDARSGTGAGLYVYVKDGHTLLAHDGVDKEIPVNCRDGVLQ